MGWRNTSLRKYVTEWANRQTDILAHRQTNRQTRRQSGGPTDRATQPDRQTGATTPDRQTDKQTNEHRKMHLSMFVYMDPASSLYCNPTNDTNNVKI